jgi:hypothetical protein
MTHSPSGFAALPPHGVGSVSGGPPEPDPRRTPGDLQYLAIDLQDELLTACNDLERLLGLLGGSCRDLGAAFHGALGLIAARRDDGANAAELLTQVALLLQRGVTALQFDDMASQLVIHTRQRLRHHADRLAVAAMGDDEDGVIESVLLRPNPVTQDEMDAGSVELF